MCDATSIFPGLHPLQWNNALIPQLLQQPRPPPLRCSTFRLPWDCSFICRKIKRSSNFSSVKLQVKLESCIKFCYFQANKLLLWGYFAHLSRKQAVLAAFLSSALIADQRMGLRTSPGRNASFMVLCCPERPPTDVLLIYSAIAWITGREMSTHTTAERGVQ